MATLSVRMMPEEAEALRQSAARNGRSMSSEMQERLKQSLTASPNVEMAALVRTEIERAFAREAARREPTDACMPNMSEADRIEWMRQ